jgi:hypothetical protein
MKYRLALLVLGLGLFLPDGPGSSARAGDAHFAPALVRAIDSQAAIVKRSKEVCADCVTRAVRVQAVQPGMAQAGRCLMNPVLEDVSMPSTGETVHGVVVDVPARLGTEVDLVRVLMVPSYEGPQGSSPGGIFAGQLCLPTELARGVRLGSLGSERVDASFTRGIGSRLASIFGSAAERYYQIYVESSPAGAEILIGNELSPLRTDALLALAPVQLKSVWLRFEGRRYPLAACKSKISSRPLVASEYHCIVR